MARGRLLCGARPSARRRVAAVRQGTEDVGTGIARALISGVWTLSGQIPLVDSCRRFIYKRKINVCEAGATCRRAASVAGQVRDALHARPDRGGARRCDARPASASPWSVPGESGVLKAACQSQPGRKARGREGGLARGDGGRGRLRRNKKETRKERGGCESIRQGARYGQCEAERRDQDRRKGGAVRPVGDREGEGEGRRKGGGAEGRGERERGLGG